LLDKRIIEPFRDTFFAGKYNLLLGAGVSLKSRNRHGHLLRGTEQLRADICALTGTSGATSLTRAYGLMTPAQRQSELIDKYSKCQPGAELFPLPRCIWKRIFTFNIDDVVEALYAQGGQQRLVPLNFDSTFEPDTDISELQCVHLHGSALQPDSGFVFSYVEYARALRGNNPWMLLLSEILPSEPFIIAGTSLNEVDLEFYLGRRTSSTPRKGRGPSLLIDPYPDNATLADCERYDLTLVKAGIGEFLAWIEQTFPSRPSVNRLTVPPIDHLFRSKISPANLLRFFSDFELVSGRSAAKSSVPKPYMYGAEPTWPDIDEHLDVERQANQPVMSWATAWLDRPSKKERVLVVSEEAATGKSTVLKRVGHDLAALGRIVLNVRTLSRIDVDTAAICLGQLASPCIVLVDNCADYVEQLRDLLAETELTASVAFLGAERRYRQEYIDLVLSDVSVAVKRLDAPTAPELEQLLEKYQQAGLLADKGFAGNPQRAVVVLQRDTIAVAVCRILNDFRPLDRIIESVWDAADADQRKVFLACALAHRCHATGVRYSVLQNVAGMQFAVSDAIGSGRPLPLAINPSDDDFLVPQSAVIADRVLGRASKLDRDLMLEVFTALAESLAPRVNRRAITMRTPEARLAGRLFDGDKIVRPLLEAEAESFYVAAKSSWGWNSRYWEQRALLIADRDIRTALQYARHAVAIEEHPLPLTTLGKVLLKSLDSVGGVAEQAKIFSEAFSTLDRAITREAEKARVTVHPFSTLLTGTARYLERGGELTLEQHDTVARYLAETRHRFGGDVGLAATVGRLDALL
jgi:hypothetical protein